MGIQAGKAERTEVANNQRKNKTSASLKMWCLPLTQSLETMYRKQNKLRAILKYKNEYTTKNHKSFQEYQHLTEKVTTLNKNNQYLKRDPRRYYTL